MKPRLALPALAIAAVSASQPGTARAGFGAPPPGRAVSFGPDDGASDLPASARDEHRDIPARKYGRLDAKECEAELAERGVPFVRVDGARGVLAPLRLTGPLHGVTFHSMAPRSQRASSPWEIVDCRLALALDDFARQLHAHDIVEVVHYSIYRPPPDSWPEERVGSQHRGALAIDAAQFLKRDGTKLDVDRDFHGRLGARPCGRAAEPAPAIAEAIELREIVCDAASAGLFNVTLTPDFNRAHHNHFHLEVAAHMPWFVVR